MSEEKLKQILKLDGWKFVVESLSFAKWCAWKRQPFWRECTHNEKPPSVFVRFHEIGFNGQLNTSCEVGVVGEIDGKRWIDLKFYSLSVEETVNDLPELVEKLGRAWEGLGGRK